MLSMGLFCEQCFYRKYSKAGMLICFRDLCFGSSSTESFRCDEGSYTRFYSLLTNLMIAVPYIFQQSIYFPTSALRMSAVAFLLRLWVWIPRGAWMSVCCGLSGRGVWRADHSSIGVLPTMVHRLWSRNLNEDTLADCSKQKIEKKPSRFGSCQLLVPVFWRYILISSRLICCRVVHVDIDQYMSNVFYCILSIDLFLIFLLVIPESVI
jgi:hypothetical protein